MSHHENLHDPPEIVPLHNAYSLVQFQRQYHHSSVTKVTIKTVH